MRDGFLCLFDLVALLVAAEEIASLRLWSMGESSRANPKLHVGSCMYTENEKCVPSRCCRNTYF